MGRNRSKKKLFIIAGVLLLAAAGTFSGIKLFRSTDAREFYFNAEKKNVQRYSNWINENYNSFQEKQTPFANNVYRRRTEVTADINSGGQPFGLKDAGRLFDLIKRSKLVVDTKRQPQDDKTLSNVSLLLEKAPFLDAELFSKAGTLYFTVPVLLPDKYFSAKLDKLDEVYDTFFIPVRPKRIIKGTDIAQTLKFDKSASDRSFEKLGSIFGKLITKDMVKYGQERTVTISGQLVKGQEMLVSLDGTSATTLLDELVTFITSDDVLLSYTYGNFADLSTMLDDAGLFRLFGYLDETGVVTLNENEKGLVNSLNVRKDTEGFKKQLKESLKDFQLKDELQMALVIDKAGNILDRKLTLDLTAQKESNSFILELHTGSSSMNVDDCRNRFLNILVTRPATDVDNNAGEVTKDMHLSKTTELSVTPVFARQDGLDTQGNIAIHYTAAALDGSKSGADINLDISGNTDNLTLKRNNSVKYQMKMIGEGGEGNLDGELNSITWKNKKLNTSNHTTKISVQANLPSFGIKDLSAVVNLAGEDRLGIEPITLPDLQQSKVTDLNTATESELNSIEMEMMISFGSFYLTNKPVFDAILGQ